MSPGLAGAGFSAAVDRGNGPQSASPPVLIMELGAVSTFKTTMDEKNDKQQEMANTMLNVPLALFQI